MRCSIVSLLSKNKRSWFWYCCWFWVQPSSLNIPSDFLQVYRAGDRTCDLSVLPGNTKRGNITVPWNTKGGSITVPWNTKGGSITVPWNTKGGSITVPWNTKGGSITVPWNTKGGSITCTVDPLFDWFELVCFANKNKNCQWSCSWFQTSRTGGQWYSDTSPFSIPWLYHWPPVWLVWNQMYDNWQFLFLFEKQTNPNQLNRRSMVQWYFPLCIPWFCLYFVTLLR